MKKEKIYPAYVSKHNSDHEKQVVLLMIPNREGWHYLAVKKLSALLRGTASKNNGEFYCLNCLHVMSSKDTKISEFNQYQKFNKSQFFIYADLECLIKKINACKNNTENSFTTKASEHIPSAFSMSTISSFKSIENKYDVYRV